jgi:hypothetical protein
MYHETQPPFGSRNWVCSNRPVIHRTLRLYALIESLGRIYRPNSHRLAATFKMVEHSSGMTA